MSQASHEFKGSVDFNQSELRNATFQRLLTPPISPIQGQIYYSSLIETPFYFNNTEWIPFGLPPIHIRYATNNDMFVNQNKQIKGYIYYNQALNVYYEYLGTTVGDITDYNPIGGENLFGNFVPYIGATQNVDLGNNDLILDSVRFNNLPVSTVDPRQLVWNQDEGTLDLGMNNGGVIQQIGLETLYRVTNQTGITIPNGSFVMAIGTVGNSGKILIAPSIADGTVLSRYMIGVATEDILNDTDGFVTWFGKVRGIDTRGTSVGEVWVDGDVLWANPIIAGGLTKTEPIAPNLKISVAIVIHAHSNGTLFIRPSLGLKLTDLHDVNAFSPNDKDIISYDFSLGHWNAKSLGTLIGGNSSQFLKGDGSLDNTQYTSNEGTVTQINTGIGLTGGPITTVGTVSLTGQVLLFHNLATNGLVYRNGATIGTRSIIGSTFINVVNGDGIAGNPTISLNVISLDNLSDVIITTPADGQVLQYNGTNWVNGTVTSGGNGTVTSITAGIGLSASPSNPITTVGTLSVLYGTIAGTAAQGNDSRFHNPVTIGTANGLSLTSQVLSLGLSSTSSVGSLSSTDWNTFNNKQNALSGTGFIKINGTTISYDNSIYYLASNPNGYINSLAHNHGIANSVGTQQFTFGVNENVRFASSGATSIAFISNTKTVTISSTDTIYTHPLKSWVNKTNLSGNLVISNLIVDSIGHPTDWTTRTLTLTDLGYTTPNLQAVTNVGNTTTNTISFNGVEAARKLIFESNDLINEIGRISFRIAGNERTYIASDRHTAGGQLSDLSFGTSGLERMRINSSGNVLIGTTIDTGNKLRVGGTVKIDTMLESFGDFVTLDTNNVLKKRSLINAQSDLNSFLVKGVRTQLNDWLRSIDNSNSYGLWQSNFAWSPSYYAERRVLQAETTGTIQSDSSLAKVFTVGWGVSSGVSYNSNSYCECLVQLGPTTLTTDVLIKGTITITSTNELKMYLEVTIWRNQLVLDRQITTAKINGVNLNASNFIMAFTGKMNVSGTHQWNQKHTFQTVL